MAKKIPSRSELRTEDTWAIEDIFASQELWEAAYDRAKTFPETVASYQGKLGTSATALYEFLTFGDQMSIAFDSLYGYAQRKSDEDTTVSLYQGMASKVISLMVACDSASAFETPEILAIPDETLEEFYRQLPELRLYERYLDKIRRKRAHILSDAEEKLLAAAGELAQSPDSIYSMFGDADLKFDDAEDSTGEKHPVTHGSYIPLMHSADRTLRKNAFCSLYRSYGNFRNTAAAILTAQVKQLKFFADARRYESALHASLDGTEVPVEVYQNLIDAVHENMQPMYRYVALTSS